MLIRELKIFFVSFLFVTTGLVYYNSNFFHNSIIEGIKTTFYYYNVMVLFIAIGFYLFGYIIFRIIYFLMDFLSNKIKFKVSPLVTSSVFVLFLFIIFLINDLLIYQNVNSYTIEERVFVPTAEVDMEIDSSNFRKYTWINTTIQTWDPECLVKEILIFEENSSFKLNVSKTNIDRLYLFRRLFSIANNYEINGNYIFENNILVYDSTDVLYSIQLKENKLYLNTSLGSI